MEWAEAEQPEHTGEETGTLPRSLTYSLNHSLSQSLTLSLQRIQEQEQYAAKQLVRIDHP